MSAYHNSAFIPFLPRLNASSNVHWRKLQRERKRWYQEVAVAFVGRKPKEPLSRAELILERRSVGSINPDPDNLASSFKAVLDGLVRCGVLEDDRPEVVGRPDFRRVRVAKRAEQGVYIEVLAAQAFGGKSA